MQLFGNSDRRIAYWLIIVAIMIYAMVLLGGVTRLTGSGLSMVQWEPILGVIPPLSHQEWEATFDKYKQFPEYQQLNRDMDLSEFQKIFAFEYTHRLLGRSIGLAFLIPFLFFFFRKQIKPSLTPKLVIMFVLGGLQGLLGWFMVKSGLVDKPNVSQFRLAAHLMTAILIYSYILWTAWGLLSPTPRNAWVPRVKNLRRQVRILTVIIVVMIISGAFVAGTHAGAVFKTFPDMNGHIIPPGLFAMSPFLSNFVENTTTIQFDHRLIAYIIVIFLLLTWYRSRHFTLTRSARNAFNLLLLVMIVQITLGISTLLSVPDVPVRAGVSVVLAAMHQGGALLLLTVVLYLNHELRKGN
ncbi:MAG: heme A synthase [Gammaproteobacteria bacterium]|nr:heme A synthase [Gammaproteobacteria bacterium]